jgi:hypothetical protein
MANGPEEMRASVGFAIMPVRLIKIAAEREGQMSDLVGEPERRLFSDFTYSSPSAFRKREGSP